MNQMLWRFTYNIVGVCILGASIQLESAEAATSPTAPVVAEWAGELGIWGPLLLGLLIALESLLAPIPGWFLVAASGLLYGFWLGLALSWTSAMVGSVAAFWLARHYGRCIMLQRIPATIMARLDHVSERNGFLILLTARIFPLTALDILSYAAGLSGIRFTPFLLATGLGFLPGTAALVAAGDQAAMVKRVDFLLYSVLSIFIVISVSRQLWSYWRKHHGKAHE